MNIGVQGRTAELRGLIRARGRLPGDVEIVVSPCLHNVAPDSLAAYHAAGVGEIVPLLPIPADAAKLPDVLERMARDWVEPAARLR